MRNSLSLFRLQSIDNQIGKINIRILIINNFITRDVSLSQAKQQDEICSTVLLNYKNLQTNLEEQVHSLRIKINQTESNLYDGTIKNPKDLRDLEKETLLLKHNLHVLEDSLLDTMEAVENNQKVEYAVRAILLDVTDKWSKKCQILVNEKETLQSNLHTLIIERNALLQSLESEALSVYEQLRQTKQGVAVSIIRENTCSSCGTSLTLAFIQAARFSIAINYCPSCGRILFCE
jgi:uncharacterized protein